MCDHEARVQAAILDEEGRQVTEGRVHQPLNPPLTYAGQLVHTYGQIVQGLEQHETARVITNVQSNYLPKTRQAKEEGGV